MIVGLVCCLGVSARLVGEETPRSETSGRLEAVLDVRRSPDADVLLLRDGKQRAGIVRNDSFRLRTPYGELSIPVTMVAGIRLADGPGGLDTIVTVTPSRFSGFLENPAFVLESGDSGERVELRRETVFKAVFRLREEEPKPTLRGPMVLLKSEDFFTATLFEDRFRIEDTGAELRWTRDRVAVVTFPDAGNGFCRLILTNGDQLRGSPIAEDLEFQTELGPRLRIYSGWIAEIRNTVIPTPELSGRIGSSIATRAASTTGVNLPDPKVVPVEGMVWLPPGEFMMGSPTQEKDRDLDEGPQTRVILPNGFWIGRHEVTQAEYAALIGRNPSQYLGDDRRPVEKVSWQEAMEYCQKLTERERTAGHQPEGYAYRLPSEAEWEYACRAGTTTRFSHGDDSGYSLTGDYAWHIGNSESGTHPAEKRKPNPWGLYDMHGNVLEWCLDEWAGTFPGGTLTNRVTHPAGSLRVARGGSWLYEARFCRSANRDSYGMLNRCSDVGFRVVLAGNRGAP